MAVAVGISAGTSDGEDTRCLSPCGFSMLWSLTLHRMALRRKYRLPPACLLLPAAVDDCCVHLCCGAAAARQVLRAFSPVSCVGSVGALTLTLLLSGMLLVAELCLLHARGRFHRKLSRQLCVHDPGLHCGTFAGAAGDGCAGRRWAGALGAGCHPGLLLPCGRVGSSLRSPC